MGPQVIEHIAASAVYKHPDKYTEEFDQYASPALINRSGAPSAGEVGLNIRPHTAYREPAVSSQADLGPIASSLPEHRANKKKRGH